MTLLHVQDREKIEGHLKDRLESFNETDLGRLERLKAHLMSHGAADVRIGLPYGLSKQEIVERANRSDISLVVRGSQGRGFLKKVFLGSVSHNIARHSDASVLLIPARKHMAP